MVRSRKPQLAPHVTTNARNRSAPIGHRACQSQDCNGGLSWTLEGRELMQVLSVWCSVLSKPDLSAPTVTRMRRGTQRGSSTLGVTIVCARRALRGCCETSLAGFSLASPGSEPPKRLRERARALRSTTAVASTEIETERRRQELTEVLSASRIRQAPAWSEIERRVRAVSATGDRSSRATWRRPEGFRRLLTAPILFTPFVRKGRRGVRFEGRIGLDALFAGDGN